MEGIEDTTQEYNPYGLICLLPVDEEHPVDRARLAKFAILMYRFDPEAGHCLQDSYMREVASLNPASDTTNSFGGFLRWFDLEMVDDEATMSMVAWVDKGIPRGPDGLWDIDCWQLGDWLDPTAPPDQPELVSFPEDDPDAFVELIGWWSIAEPL
ncbi:hypothetical protein BDV06DRAFT_223424 [Aspergillus oleicola]